MRMGFMCKLTQVPGAWICITKLLYAVVLGLYPCAHGQLLKVFGQQILGMETHNLVLYLKGMENVGHAITKYMANFLV